MQLLCIWASGYFMASGDSDKPASSYPELVANVSEASQAGMRYCVPDASHGFVGVGNNLEKNKR
jgi:hypothetical protein